MIKMLTGIFTGVIALLYSLPATALFLNGNHGDGTIRYNINMHAGTMLPHNDELIYLNREYIRSIEINTWFYQDADGQRNNIPGIGYHYSTLGNREVFGNLHAIYGSLLHPVGRRKIPLEFRISLGVAWATEKFHVENNHFNRAIGSHLNMYGQVGITGTLALPGDRWYFMPGLSFRHVSNGTIVSPNSGINMLTVSAGLAYRSSHSHSGTAIFEERDNQGKNRFWVVLAPGIKQMDRRIDRTLITSSILIDYGYMLGRQFSLGIGLGFFYNDTWAYGTYTTGREELYRPFQSALHLSIHRDIGRISFFIHPGTYIFIPAREVPYFTGRLGMRYRLENNFTASFAIKHHWLAVADYFEWGIGYEFKR